MQKTIAFKSSLGIFNVQPGLRPIYFDYRTCKSSDEEVPEDRRNLEGFPDG